MWAMKGESRMSSSSQMTCTAYSPGSVGQYRTSQEPSPLSSHSILACEGPSMEKPGEEGQGSESIRRSQASGRSPMFPSAPSPVTPMSPLYAYPDSLPCLTVLPSSSSTSVLFVTCLMPPSHLPSVPTSVPMASTTKSADLPTWPVSNPGPHARTFWAPASGLTWTSKGLRIKKELASVSGSAPVRDSPLLFLQVSRSIFFSLQQTTQTGGCRQGGGIVLTCGEWRSHPK